MTGSKTPRKLRVLITLSLFLPETVLAVNLAPNPSFEVASNPSFPDGWINYAYPDFYPLDRLRLVQDEVFDGKNSLRINVVPITGLRRPYHSPFVSCYRIQSFQGLIHIPEARGPYTLSAYMKGTRPGRKVSMGLMWKGGGKSQDIQLADSWTRYSLTVDFATTAQPDEVSPEIVFQAIDTEEPYTFWVDAVQLEPGLAASSFSKGEMSKVIAPTRGGNQYPEQRDARPFIHCARVNEPPIIDGDLSDPCWSKAVRVSNFVDYKIGKLAIEQTEAFLMRDEDNLYVAFRCFNPQKRKVKVEAAARDGDVWRDDAVEVFLDTNLGGTSHYQFLLNAAGVQADVERGGDRLSQVVGAQPANDYSWDGVWRSASRVMTDQWTAEIQIPFSTLGLGENSSAVWGVNFCRDNPGIGEYSSWAFTDGKFDHATKRFGRMDGMNMSPCLMEARHVSQTEFLWKDLSAKMLAAKIRLDALPEDCGELDFVMSLGGNGEEIQKKVSIKKNDAQTLRIDGIPSSVFPESASELDCIVSINRRNLGTPLLNMRRRVSVPPLFEAYLDRNYYTREKEATLCITLPHLKEKMTEGWTTRVETTNPAMTILAKAISGLSLVPLRLERFSIGTHEVKVQLIDPKGSSRASTTIILDRKGPSPTEVKIDHRLGCILVNGQPFVPYFFGVSSTVPWPHLIQEAASLGFNGIITRFEDSREHDDLEDIRQSLDLINSKGLKVIFWLRPDKNDLHSTKEDPQFWDEYVEATERVIRTYIPQFRNHPALIGWKFADEWWGKDTTARLYRLCRELDPYRPAFHNQTGGDSVRQTRPEWFKGVDLFTDIVSWDVYPFGYLDNSNQLIEMLDNVVRHTMTPLASRRHLPMMFWQQMINVSGRLPTKGEYLAEAYLLAMYGVRGLFTFFHKPEASELWEAAGIFGKEWSTLQGVFEKGQGVNIEPRSNGPIRWTHLKGENSDYIIAVNLSNDEHQAEVDLTKGGVRTSGPVKVLFEDRKLVPVNGVIKDAFHSLERHVYLIQRFKKALQ